MGNTPADLVSYSPDLATITIIVVVWLVIYLLPLVFVHRWALRMKPRDEPVKKWVKPVFAGALLVTIVFHWLNSVSFFARTNCADLGATWNENSGTCRR